VRILLFYHSLVSDWNHGNAHFLRGVATELVARGHDVEVWESRNAWSRGNLLCEHGDPPQAAFREAFPELRSRLYDLAELDVERVTESADLVIVHEWNEPWLVRAIGAARRRARFRLLFHDTHHRSVTAPEEMERYDLSEYDGVLAYGRVMEDIYRERGWADQVWTWHEAADVRVFQPLREERRERDLVWIGNWGDDERTEELREFLIRPARRLRLDGTIYGVRYPKQGVRALRRAGLRYRGWLPNHCAPAAFARHRITVHIPRRPYVVALPGIPTIRPFEALACGIPLVSAPWDDVEGLFEGGRDYLVARDGREMRALLREVLADEELARSLAEHGRRTILDRHTCAHRVDELLAIVRSLRAPLEATA
jgi:spore maturation protein CgeB